MSTDTARNTAKLERAKLIRGAHHVNPREGATFAQAFDGGYEIMEQGKRVHVEGYIQYLERKAALKKKPPRWAKNVRSLGKLYLLPKWGKYRLTEMAEIPNQVAEWCAKEIESATNANHCARIIRAMYKRAAKKDLRLDKANVPTAAVEMQKERGEQKGMIWKQFPAWFATWQKIEHPVRRAFHMVNLLSGARPGELGRTRWRDYDTEADTLTIGDAKADNTIIIPVTPEIRKALKLAAEARPDHKPDDFIFTGCQQFQHRDKDELPARGHALRRTWKTFAQNECGVREEISASLIGHVPEGMSQRYVLRWAQHHGTAIIEAQHKVSRAIDLALRGKHRTVAMGKRAA